VEKGQNTLVLKVQNNEIIIDKKIVWKNHAIF
jgi:hypothetical protein